MRKEERPLGDRTGTARIKVLNHSLQPNCRKNPETGVTCRVAENSPSILNLGNFKCVLNKDGFFHQLCENAQEGIIHFSPRCLDWSYLNTDWAISPRGKGHCVLNAPLIGVSVCVAASTPTS